MSEITTSVQVKATHAEFVRDNISNFTSFCSRVEEFLGVTNLATKRQASKFRRRFGIVYTTSKAQRWL